ncbi:RluA family pseudouridine synthase [Rickettsiales endosymbiont of Paramecium tredecaurelia]|uniref:RluA family pseudouridine synthase n=1 Tax=Candidatus Sarmatiella mevalonica TaxID=2770581 RepID=UPI0019224541|nr:RluA family pseudouridine synthase [Candidatus Sarmatiella mevalonica]MBL3284443.1 RluA family pseudouridine synthase [Candidatus Sarmatiella mevalonica]
MQTLIVTCSDSGVRLDVFLAKSFSHYSRVYIQNLIENGKVLLNNNCVKASRKLLEEDVVQIDITQHESHNSYTTELKAVDIDFNVVYEDQYLIVINKPANLTVHPGAGNKDNTLVNALLYRYSKLSNLGDPHRVGIVHRLDKDTSGLMLVAKDNTTHYSLSKQIEERLVHRKYKALVWGEFKPSSGKFETKIARSMRDRLKMQAIAMDESKGKIAITHYRTLELFYGIASLVEFTLDTGRTHQIRVHASHAGHSIVGDMTYGALGRNIPKNISLPYKQFIMHAMKRQALHAYCISFSHPISKKRITFEVDLPNDMNNFIASLRNQQIPYSN